MRGDLNTLEMPAGASPTYNRFLRKLDTLIATGGVDVRVLHVGGSHVQGGTWSDRLRRNFLSLRYGADGGRGLVFPFSAAGTNTPSATNRVTTRLAALFGAKSAKSTIAKTLPAFARLMRSWIAEE